MEGPNGCRPKSFRFLPIGLLGIVKMDPRALHWGPTQISLHPTWLSMWRKFGAKTLCLSKENGPRFSLASIIKLGLIWDWSLKWVKGLYTKRPNCRPICKTRAHLLTQIPYQMDFSPNGLGPKCKVPLTWDQKISRLLFGQLVQRIFFFFQFFLLDKWTTYFTSFMGILSTSNSDFVWTRGEVLFKRVLSSFS
jgi:hypothetical protein